MAPTPDELKQKIAELEEKVEANEHNHEEVKKASLEAVLEAMTDDEKEELKAALNDEEVEEPKKAKSKKGGDDEEVEEKIANLEKEKMEAKIRQMSATIKSYESERSGELINELVALKSSLVPTADEDTYRLRLMAKSFAELNQMHSERKEEIAAMNASEKEEGIHFGFGLKASTQSKMTSMSDILNNGGIN